MPRRGPVSKRKISPDPIYNDKLVAQLINNILRKGKKSLAERIVYEAFDIIRKKTGNDPIDVLKKAVNNVKPLLEVRSRRVGGANYQVPVAVRSERSFILACRWILDAARSRKGKKMAEKLADELINAYNNEGTAIKKKQDTYRMAEANRAFAHFGR